MELGVITRIYRCRSCGNQVEAEVFKEFVEGVVLITCENCKQLYHDIVEMSLH